MMEVIGEHETVQSPQYELPLEETTALQTEKSGNQASNAPETYRFKQWIRSIRKNKVTKFQGPSRYVVGWPDDEALDDSYKMMPQPQDNQADRSSLSSSSALRTVKTASVSMSLDSFSMFNRPRTNTQASTQRSACHSSGFSSSDARKSVDSNRLASTLSLDEGAWNRAVQRRQIIREMTETEITYVAGLKALANVCITSSFVQPHLRYLTVSTIRSYLRLS